jgi:hypothetical protein
MLSAINSREHLLQLPRNTSAFRALEDRGTHPAFADLAKRLEQRRRRASPQGAGAAPGAAGGCGPALARRLQRTLSQLAHWCPLFGEGMDGERYGGSPAGGGWCAAAAGAAAGGAAPGVRYQQRQEQDVGEQQGEEQQR